MTARAQLSPLQTAVELRERGRLDEAERICEAVLADDPHDFEALHLAGVLNHQQGRSGEALRLVAAALKRNPGSTDALVNHGIILQALGHHDEALASFDQALAQRADDPALYRKRAAALLHLGRHAEALECIDQLLALGMSDSALYCQRGAALQNLGRQADALQSYDRAVELGPDLGVAHYLRGNALAMLDRPQAALASYDRVVALALARAGMDAAALDSDASFDGLGNMLSGALAEDPYCAAALGNRGTVLLELKRYEEARASYDKALALQPDCAEALGNRGVALGELGCYEAALSDYEKAVRLAPNFTEAHVNRGNALLALNRVDEALRCYVDVIAREPEHADAHFNAAVARLCMGDFRTGWKEYEYRWSRKKNPVPRPRFSQPMWRGGQELQDKTILLCAEQGMGDAIQFVRYAPLVAARGARVLLRVQPALTAVMATVAGVSRVLGDNDATPDFDLYCPLLNLPSAFDTTLTTIPADVPYIRPYDSYTEKWRARLSGSGRLRIGLCWAGSAAHGNDRRRSIALQRFAPLLSVPDVDFVSLQNEVGAAEAGILHEHGVNQLGQEFRDFADTAAVVAMLDLIIAVDTSVAHLAGAMGKAVALLVPFSPDFRWMLDRTDSPWYPTMRLFRQTAINDWSGPLDQLCRELGALARRRVMAR